MKKPFIFIIISAILLSTIPEQYGVGTVYADPTCSGAQVGGTVFIDTNINGDRDGGEPDVDPAAGIEIFVYGNDGTLLGTDITGPSGPGDWTVSLGGYTGAVRIEFDLPATIDEFASARFASSGTGSGTTVAFANNGDCNIDLGLQVLKPGTIGSQTLDPFSSCTTDNTDLITSCFVLADGSYNTGGDDTIVSFPYESGAAHSADRPFPDSTIGSTDTNTTAYDGPHIRESSAPEVGAVYGMAYHRASDTIFSASFLKRHSAFGTGGTGAIYITDRRYPDGDANRNNVFVTIPGTGANPHAGNSTRTDWRTDAAAYYQVSRVGLGDLDLDNDEDTLWTMNLGNRRLYSVAIGTAFPTAGAIRSYPSSGSLSGLVNGAGGICAGQTDRDIVPFAVRVHLEQVYIGITCTAESLAGDVFTNRDQMHFLVYRMDPSTATGALSDFNLVLDVPLIDPSYTPNSANRLRVVNSWRRWNDDWTAASCSGGSGTYMGFCENPQPLLADIEFTQGNDIVLGFRDRWGDMTGARSFDPTNPADITTTYDGVGYGDVLFACYTGANISIPPTNGDYELENDASCTGNSTSGGTQAGIGPGGGSYYYSDYWYDPSHTVANITLGGLAIVPGTSELVTTVQDPISNSGATRDGGVIWMNNDTGNRTRAFRLFNTNPAGTTPDEQIETFGKANGLGDIEFNCVINLEVGNRVWIDTDLDGIQDPDETPVAGVQVDIYEDVNGNGIAEPGEYRGTSITDADGQYLFNETNVEQTDGINTIYQGLKPFTDYLMVMNNPADFDPTGPLADLFPTLPNVDPTLQRGDVRDNDGVPNAALGNIQFAQITFSTAGLGDNQHTFDFGFSPVVPVVPPTPAATIVTAELLEQPVVIKSVNPQLVQLNQDIIWTITITNPNDVEFPGFYFLDPIDPRLEIISAEAIFGTVTIDLVTNEVSYLGTIPANTSDVITIVTLLRSTVRPPFSIENRIERPDPIPDAVVTAYSFPTQLPDTGEVWRWITDIRTLLLISVIVVSWLTWRRWRLKQKL